MAKIIEFYLRSQMLAGPPCR